jgi:hypothetical protein
VITKLVIISSLVLALLTATATAAPLFLKCEGKDVTTDTPALHSIKIDGASVEVDGMPAGKINDSRAHIWSFGNEKEQVSGTVDRITGEANITFHMVGEVLNNLLAAVPENPRLGPPNFTGTCRKAEKLF